MSELQAWCNGYEVVAARSIEEAREIVKGLGYYNPADNEELDGDGWTVLSPERVIKDDDGSVCGSVASIMSEADFPRHLWSVAQ